MWIRMLSVLLAARLRASLPLFGESRLPFRVLPGDLDYNIHMNNARYLALMDVGRVDLILRTGLWRAMWQHRWSAVLAGSLVRYRRSLKPFQRLELKSRLIGWDEKWFYIEHRIEAGGALACQAIVRGAFLGADGVVVPAMLASAVGHAGASPPLPSWARSWHDADRALELGTQSVLVGA
ncbi:MAG: thioesterase family protein [Rhizomicrobium sp.]|nr:thioesterase family protein [Rhizomicrobium sp.]